jgi:hypothetical protein
MAQFVYWHEHMLVRWGLCQATLSLAFPLLAWPIFFKKKERKKEREKERKEGVMSCHQRLLLSTPFSLPIFPFQVSNLYHGLNALPVFSCSFSILHKYFSKWLSQLIDFWCLFFSRLEPMQRTISRA